MHSVTLTQFPFLEPMPLSCSCWKDPLLKAYSCIPHWEFLSATGHCPAQVAISSQGTAHAKKCDWLVAISLLKTEDFSFKEMNYKSPFQLDFWIDILRV